MKRNPISLSLKKPAGGMYGDILRRNTLGNSAFSYCRTSVVNRHPVAARIFHDLRPAVSGRDNRRTTSRFPPRGGRPISFPRQLAPCVLTVPTLYSPYPHHRLENAWQLRFYPGIPNVTIELGPSGPLMWPWEHAIVGYVPYSLFAAVLCHVG